MINWQVRLKNKHFWLTLIPAVLLFVQTIMAPLGLKLHLEILNQQLLDIVNSAFTLLVLLGIVNDPTTHSLRDSNQALTYQKPKKD